MAKKLIEGLSMEETATWYKAPVYKVYMVKDSSTPSPQKKLTSPQDVFDLVSNYLAGADREHFVIVLLDRKNNVIGVNTVSVGDVSSSIVHPREVFKPAIILGASAVMLAHNHPSGDPAPSPEDKVITKRLAEAGEILGIAVMDHIITGDDGRFVSLKRASIL